MSFEFRPLTEWFGAEICGLDLSTQSPEDDFPTLEETFYKKSAMLSCNASALFRFSICALLLCSFLSAPGFAQQSCQQIFAQMDAIQTADGKVARSEFVTALRGFMSPDQARALFDRHDMNADGFFNMDEYISSNNNCVDDGTRPEPPPPGLDQKTTNGTPYTYLHGLDSSLSTDEEFEAADKLDEDGDGNQTWQEYQAGTDPRDPNSYLRITHIQKGGKDTEVMLTWNTEAGKTYKISHSLHLHPATSSWQALESDIEGTGVELSKTYAFEDDASANFYRVAVEEEKPTPTGENLVTISVNENVEGFIHSDLAGSQNRLDYLTAMGGTGGRYCCGGIWPHIWQEDGNHNWSFLDGLVEDYINQGIRMTLNFGWTPQWLWSDPDNPALQQLAAPSQFRFLNFMKIGNAKPPADYEKWKELVRETVHYLNIVKGYDIVFEIVNEPNSDWFWRGTLQEVIEYYEITARVVKEVDPDALVGGIGIAGGPLPNGSADRYNWVKAFIEYSAENNVPVDFISWHYYEQYAQQAGRARSVAYQAELIQELVDQNPGIGDPFFTLTEWGWSWTPSEVLNGAYNGAFSAQVFHDLVDNNFRMANLSTALDINMNLNHPNYAFSSFEMFNRLSSQRVRATKSGENTLGILASKEDGKVSAMIWDFPGGPNGIRTETNNVKVTFDDIPAGEYTLKRYIHKSDRNDGTSLRTVDTQSVSAGTLVYEFDITTYDVALIEIVKN